MLQHARARIQIWWAWNTTDPVSHICKFYSPVCLGRVCAGHPNFCGVILIKKWKKWKFLDNQRETSADEAMQCDAFFAFVFHTLCFQNLFFILESIVNSQLQRLSFVFSHLAKEWILMIKKIYSWGFVMHGSPVILNYWPQQAFDVQLRGDKLCFYNTCVFLNFLH